MKTITFLILAMFLTIISCSQKSNVQNEAQTFLNKYNKDYQKYLYAWNEGEWALNTKIVEGDTVTSKLARDAAEQYAKFTGSKENIENAAKYLQSKDELTELQIKQLKRLLYLAANNPETAGKIVKEKIKADTKQTELLYGFDYKLNGKSITTNEIDEMLNTETDVKKRLEVWETSKEVGKVLKDGLENLRSLRNGSVQALDYNDFFSYQVSDYGMTVDEMRKVCQSMIKDIWSLYRELHTWARYTLAEKYGAEVPEMLPANWLPNRMGTGLDRDSKF